ncbi:hypothetical protein [Qipengyuania sp. MTN3-11]|uniref:hypothetical protein n=1 Tax=Qipengyuania sp. MTN3-11 TaxID=3056557 RepID=UPI0036F2E2E6
MRWSIYATVEAEPFVFELQKFGCRIMARRGVSLKLLDRVSGQLSASLKLLEPLLKRYAESQIAEGRLTLENRMSLHDGRYFYFRGLADEAFAFRPSPAGKRRRATKKSATMGILTEVVEQMNLAGHAEQKGFFASGAMVDAWFSRLEHRMLILRAFVGKPIAAGGFNAFVAAPWDDRLVALFDGSMDRVAGDLLGKLREVKAKIRNPLAHGGIESDGGAFYFHLPGVGAIPANLSRYRGRVQLSFVPIPAATHAETCALFDAVDTLLTTGPFQLPNEFVRWGIDPQYDAESVGLYGEAIREGAEAVEVLVDQLGREWERHTNMDY